ncbi:hypothetical protein BDY21DRAFT_345778 [Lineolata rhizophorae]|uniref:Secreted protein n=1 Tax=Lineolata rhizophorae TaxID=578093 RepID=A0A6A6NY46_9PEZI|nr:hypothetical protein BDY21DRAFT_345778 [Lineolata rhizophorae]
MNTTRSSSFFSFLLLPVLDVLKQAEIPAVSCVPDPPFPQLPQYRLAMARLTAGRADGKPALTRTWLVIVARRLEHGTLGACENADRATRPRRSTGPS